MTELACRVREWSSRPLLLERWLWKWPHAIVNRYPWTMALDKQPLKGADGCISGARRVEATKDLVPLPALSSREQGGPPLLHRSNNGHAIRCQSNLQIHPSFDLVAKLGRGTRRILRGSRFVWLPRLSKHCIPHRKGLFVTDKDSRQNNGYVSAFLASTIVLGFAMRQQ